MKFQLIDGSKAIDPPHAEKPGRPRVRRVSNQPELPLAEYPPNPPSPASPPPPPPPPTNTTIWSAARLKFGTCTCWLVLLGLKVLAVQLFPPAGEMAARSALAFNRLEMSRPTCSSADRRAGSLKNPLS